VLVRDTEAQVTDTWSPAVRAA